MHSINIEELLKKNNINVIDIRNNSKYNSGHIPGAINIPEINLSLNPSKYLNKNNIYYLYCEHGSRASMLVNLLNSMGYNCVNINGGYYNYLLRK